MEKKKNVFEKPFIYHSSADDDGTRVTIAGEYVDGVLNLSASRCSKHDSFVKKEGIKLATERLKNKEYVASVNIEEISTKEFINVAIAVADSVSRNGLEAEIILIPNRKLRVVNCYGDAFSVGPDMYSYFLI